MLIKFLRRIKIYVILIGVISLSSCGTVHSLKDNRIAPEIRLHFSQIALDSAQIPNIQPLRVSNDNYISIYSLEGTFVDTEFIGFIKEQKISKSLPGVPEQEIGRRKIKVKLDCMFCCSNHQPKDCVKTKAEVRDSSEKKGCNKWEVILL